MENNENDLEHELTPEEMKLYDSDMQLKKMQDTIDANITNFLLKVNVNINIKRDTTPKGITNDGKETLKSTPKKNDKKKIGRNDLCQCGSGKKYKNCCGK